eukprot:472559-Hanusia_phi.AAC.1
MQAVTGKEPRTRECGVGGVVSSVHGCGDQVVCRLVHAWGRYGSMFDEGWSDNMAVGRFGFVVPL